MASTSEPVIEATPQVRKRRGPHLLSSVLFLAAVAFAGVAGYLYWNEQQDEKNEPTPPPAVAGMWDFAQVRQQFDDAGFSTDVVRTTAHSDQISVTPGQSIPGQGVTVDGIEVYIFIFSRTAESTDPAAAAAAAYSAIDPATITLTRGVSGDEISEGDPYHVFHGSNIIAVMVGGDDDDVEKVKATIEGLT